MNINLSHEQLKPLSEIARECPVDFPVSLSTLARWARHGVNGIRLETLKIGGRRMTSKESIVRFVELVATADQQQSLMNGGSH